MKTVIKTHINGEVSITRDDQTNTYWCPIDGGYVRDIDDKQVCEKLYSRGDTLYCHSRAALADIIRREYRRSTR